MLNRKISQGQILNFNNNLMTCRPTAGFEGWIFLGKRKTKLSSTKYKVHDDSYNWQFARRIVLHLQCIYIYIYILTGEVCGGTVREVNAETERAASPGTAKHQVAPLWMCGLEDCHVMLIVLKHKLGHVALLYFPSVHIFFRIWGRVGKW